MFWLRAVAIPLLWMVVTSCSPGEKELFVELKTDFVPGAEFARARTVVRAADGPGASWEGDSPAMVDADYIAGQRVAELSGITPGDLVVRVELFAPDGRQFIERTVRVVFRESSGVTVIITRNCQGVVCPEEASPASYTECLGGSCVSPECMHGDEEACGEPQCADPGDCVTPASCAAAVCDRGVCFARALLDGCPAGQYCDAAVGCLDLPDVPDGGTDADAGVDVDADAGGGCTTDADCDDAIDCTTDTCEADACVHAPDDSVCTDGSGGTCIDGFGCQYDGCTAETCVAGACETARCDGDSCVIETSCTSGDEMCCGDACVPLGCDDGNPCTDDSCGSSGCVHAPNAAMCDDGTFCNGTDRCSGGSCGAHSGNPCSSGTTCDEAGSSCVGCLSNADCPDDIVGPWGTCGGFSGTCDETGTRSRTVTSFACSSGTCVPTDASETEACMRSTTSLTCGTTTFGTWSACGGYADACDETGTRSRSRTDRVCMSGSCSDRSSIDTGSCSRDTDTTTCGTTTYGTWGACGGYADTCDETGTRSRAQTEHVCVTGTCQDRVSIDTGACSRTTGGTTCGATSYGTWGPCTSFSSVCDETGMRSRTNIDRVCVSGACSDQMNSESEACGRTTDGANCDDFASCRRGTCNGGSCSLTGSGCSGSQRCCEPGICVCTACACP